MKNIFFVSRSCRLHRKMKMSFYEDKTAEILSENKNVKCFIISTALHKNQKNIIKKKINKVNYFSLPNNEPEVFNIKFSDLINKLVQDDKKNFIIFNQFYKIGKKLNDYSKASFFYSLHCPFSANFSAIHFPIPLVEPVIKATGFVIIYFL